MISNEKVVNNKVVQPNVIYNSCIGNFSIRQNGSIHCSQLGTSFILITYNYVRDVCICEGCIIYFVETKLDGEMTKIKVVDLDDFYNFVVDNVFI